MKKVVLTNAFSINMLNGQTNVAFTKLAGADVGHINLWLTAGGFTSAVGHETTAKLFGHLLGIDVPVNRTNVILDNNTSLIVGQYKGPRLPEGAIELPDGATIEWWLVEQCE